MNDEQRDKLRRMLGDDFTPTPPAGRRPPRTGTRRFTIVAARLDQEQVAALDAIAATVGVSRTAVVTELVAQMTRAFFQQAHD